VTYLSLVLIFYLLFKIFIKQEKLERQLTSLVRSLSLKEAKSPSAKPEDKLDS